MNLKRSPATVTGSSQEIIVIPLKKEHPANFLLNNNASAKPMINWKKIEPTVKINVFAIDLLGNNYIQLLEENQNKGIHQLIGNAVYVCTNTIEMHEIAKKIFNGEAVDMFAKQDNE